MKETEKRNLEALIWGNLGCVAGLSNEDGVVYREIYFPVFSYLFDFAAFIKNDVEGILK